MQTPSLSVGVMAERAGEAGEAPRTGGRGIGRLTGEADAHTDQATVLGGDASAATQDTLKKGTAAPQMAALAIGAPEFQRR